MAVEQYIKDAMIEALSQAKDSGIAAAQSITAENWGDVIYRLELMSHSLMMLRQMTETVKFIP